MSNNTPPVVDTTTTTSLPSSMMMTSLFSATTTSPPLTLSAGSAATAAAVAAAAAGIITVTSTPVTGTFPVDVVTVTWLRIANSTEHCFALRQIDETVMRLSRTQEDRDGDAENSKVEESVSLRHACSCLAIPLYPATHEEIIELKRASAIGCRAPCASLILGADLIRVLTTFGRRTFAGIIKDQLTMIGDTTIIPEHCGILTGRSPSDNPKKKKSDGIEEIISGTRKTPLKRNGNGMPLTIGTTTTTTTTTTSTTSTPTGSGSNSTTTTTSANVPTTRARAVPPPQGPTKSKQSSSGDEYDAPLVMNNNKRQRPTTRGGSTLLSNPITPNGSTLGLLDQPQHQHPPPPPHPQLQAQLHAQGNTPVGNLALSTHGLSTNSSGYTALNGYQSTTPPPKIITGTTAPTTTTTTGTNINTNATTTTTNGNLLGGNNPSSITHTQFPSHPPLSHPSHPPMTSGFASSFSSFSANNNSNSVPLTVANSTLLQQNQQHLTSLQPQIPYGNPILARTTSSGTGLSHTFSPSSINSLYDPNSSGSVFNTTGNLHSTSSLLSQKSQQLGLLPSTTTSNGSTLQINIGQLKDRPGSGNQMNLLGTPSNRIPHTRLDMHNHSNVSSSSNILLNGGLSSALASAPTFPSSTGLTLPSVLSGASGNPNPPTATLGTNPHTTLALTTNALLSNPTPHKSNSTFVSSRFGGLSLQPTLSSYNSSAEQAYGSTIAGAPILGRQPTGVLGGTLLGGNAPLVIASGPVNVTIPGAHNPNLPLTTTTTTTTTTNANGINNTTTLTHTNSQLHHSNIGPLQPLSTSILANALTGGLAGGFAPGANGGALTGSSFHQHSLHHQSSLNRRPQSGFGNAHNHTSGNLPLSLGLLNANNSHNSGNTTTTTTTNSLLSNNSSFQYSTTHNDPAKLDNTLQFSRINSQHNLSLGRINSGMTRSTVSGISSRNPLLSGMVGSLASLPGNPITSIGAGGTGNGNSPTTTGPPGTEHKTIQIQPRLQQPPTTLSIAPSALPTSFK